jgi:hypothetical protein
MCLFCTLIMGLFVDRMVPLRPPRRTPCPITAVIVDERPLRPGSTVAPKILDANRGKLDEFPLASNRAISWASCAPWRDDRGHFQVVGFSWRLEGPGEALTDKEFSMIRLEYPGGQVLSSIQLDTRGSMGGPTCWFPSAEARVLYAARDGCLYRVDFEKRRHNGAVDPIRDPRPAKIGWQVRSPAESDVYCSDPFWPSDTRLGGRLLVALRRAEPDADALSPWRIWWLRLDPTASAVVEAGQLSVTDESGSKSRRRSHRFPSLATQSDGSLTIAYLSHEEGNQDHRLHVARLRIDEPTGKLALDPLEVRILGHPCLPVAPVFSADGGRVLVPRAELDGVDRFAVRGLGFDDQTNGSSDFTWTRGTPRMPLASWNAQP